MTADISLKTEPMKLGDDSKVPPANRSTNSKNATPPVFKITPDALHIITKTMPCDSNGVKNYDTVPSGFAREFVPVLDVVQAGVYGSGLMVES